MKKAKLKIQFYNNNNFKYIPLYLKCNLLWKDKFGTPRCERCPHFNFEWLWFGIYGQWGDDNYWEQWLWVYKYHNGDIEKAKNEYGWIDLNTNKSTWIDY